MRTILRTLAPGLLVAAGCFSPQTQPEKPASVSRPVTRRTARVNAEQVTLENAHQKCQALRREMEEDCREAEETLGEGAR
ncbi:MAG: hypothetical protein L0Z62_19945 [Gemmataceae bacterium]|nr:hypothetical protein [Gemmataceae bacterium]